MAHLPKPKPDQVVRHEIVLGRSERELISDGLLAYQVNRISTPLVALLSDASAMGLIFGGIATYYGFKFDIIPGAYSTTLEMYNDFMIQLRGYYDTVQEVREDPIRQIINLIIPNVPNPYSGMYRPDPTTIIPQVENPDVYPPTGSNPVFGSPI